MQVELAYKDGMKKVIISNECASIIKGKNLDYKLTEILGMIDYETSSLLRVIPKIDSESSVEISIGEDTYNEICKNFKNITDVNSVVELLLWMYGLMGRNI